ncbi:MAG: quinone oxidoreductase [Candidatus Eremiobacteraeota bacterium]|nr:quinone oxidoreductase [Candidatus Eremiobacteraeota bacterium]
MKAIQVLGPGGPDVLKFVDVPTPKAGRGEALVRLAAIGVNFIDVYQRNGTYRVAFPAIPGSEGAGTVEQVGEGAADFRDGDRVAYAGAPGAYAEYACVPAEQLVRIPDAISFQDAAATMLQGMTAHYLCTSTFALQGGNMALIHAGAGGVGLLLTQLAKARGATVITTVSTAEKEALSREAGADHVIRYTDSDFAAEARRISGGRGVDVVYDSVGKTTFEKSLDCLRPRGMLALFGASSGPVPPFDPQTLNAKGSLFLTRPTLAHYIATREELEWRSRDLFGALRRGTLKLRIGQTYPLEHAARAHTDLESRRTTGKLLLIPPLA